jgi:monovalent cation:H+ antiporter-2, CPA2 family
VPARPVIDRNMPHNTDLILTLAGALGAALGLGFLTQRLGLSPIVGYLLAGVVVGPFTPGFVADHGLAEQLSELGVVLLMFGVGLNFHVDELLAVRRIAVPGAILQSAVATLLGAVVGHAFGWSWTAGVVFGLAVAVASTVVLTRVLEDHRALHSPTGHIAIGWLVVEDLLTVLVLVLLPVLVGGEGGMGELAREVALALVKVGALVAFTFVFGARVLPRALGYVAKTRSRELFTLTVLVLALGIAVAAAEFFGASMALGAFLAGMVVGQSEFGARAASEALPFRDAFAVLFFVAVGMLFDPAQLVQGWPIALATLLVVCVGKPLAAILTVRVLGRPLGTALTVGVALGQIGEFSFIVATLGHKLGVLPAAASQALVVTAIASITLNPPLYRLAARLGARPTQSFDDGPGAPHPEEGDRVVVVGYGPVGRLITRVLRDHGLSPVVIDLNLDTVRSLKEAGIHALYGDASQREILERAGIDHARRFILSAPMDDAEAAIRLARSLNPGLQVMARSAYASGLGDLERAGAAAFSSEIEVAVSMIGRLTRQLGASPEEADVARVRARAELSVTA